MNLKQILPVLLTSFITTGLQAQERSVQKVDWRIAASIPAAQRNTQALGLAGAISGVYQQILLVGGGSNFPEKMPWEGGAKKYYNQVFLYQHSRNGLSLLPSTAPLRLPFNLAYSALCNTTKGIVVAGGENEQGRSSKVYRLKPTAGNLNIEQLPDLPQALNNAAAAVSGHTLYIAGGETSEGVSTQFLSLDLRHPEKGWKTLAALQHPVSHTVLLSAGAAKETLYLIGGRKSNPGSTSTLYQEVWAYNVKTNTWQAKNALPYALSAASGIARNNELLLFSGDQGQTFHQTETLIAAISEEKDPAKKEALNQQKATLQASHPGFSKAVLQYNVQSDTWKEITHPMPYGTVTTHAQLLGNDIIIAGGETKAGVRTPQIMLGQIH